MCLSYFVLLASCEGHERVVWARGSDDPGGTRITATAVRPRRSKASKCVARMSWSTEMSKSAALERQCGRLSATGTAQAHLS